MQVSYRRFRQMCNFALSRMDNLKAKNNSYPEKALFLLFAGP
jgi:hypothetical protein